MSIIRGESGEGSINFLAPKSPKDVSPQAIQAEAEDLNIKTPVTPDVAAVLARRLFNKSKRNHYTIRDAQKIVLDVLADPNREN